MKTLNTLIISLCLTSISAFGQQVEALPKKNKNVHYKLENENFNLANFNTTVLDTTGKINVKKIYYRFDARPTLSARKGKYLMLIFRNNGMVKLFSDTIALLPKDSLKYSNDPGGFDRYVIENKNEIKMELYRDAITDKGWWSGKIYQHQIVFDKVNNTKETMIFTDTIPQKKPNK